MSVIGEFVKKIVPFSRPYPYIYFRICRTDDVEGDKPDDSLVDQIGGREAEQELGSVGRLLLLHLLLSLHHLLILVDLLLRLLRDSLEWVTQVDGEERAVRKKCSQILVTSTYWSHLLTKEGALISEPGPSPT